MIFVFFIVFLESVVVLFQRGWYADSRITGNNFKCIRRRSARSIAIPNSKSKGS
ncbi:hypothetical protein COCNU_02G000720 [Cocos nucifera]|uniref:Uncharacterized protein n=1 Tax=Cocos nucifera TaxID=13894 RepID=A0A8K0HYB8_COCNU|nr:hypothetical protein COCNU_02G000720 [Cocos nucifera]